MTGRDGKIRTGVCQEFSNRLVRPSSDPNVARLIMNRLRNKSKGAGEASNPARSQLGFKLLRDPSVSMMATGHHGDSPLSLRRVMDSGSQGSILVSLDWSIKL